MENDNDNSKGTQVFGEISWNSDLFEKKFPNAKDLFLRLDEGENEIRLITQPYQYLMHRYKKDESEKYGQKINCSAPNGECPMCNLGDRAKARWLIGVISRKTGSYKILDLSYAVFSQIRKLAQNSKWGDPAKYDICIIVDKAGGATGYYSTQPLSKEPLSAADQKIVDSIDYDDLKRRVTPPDAKWVKERMEKIVGGDMVKPSKGATPPTVSLTDELDAEFPSYESSTN